ncbi:MAG TPA: hypothetical protein VLL54_09030 [Pyrinomonadaceae bacterium]|nr:hypothetical protein [Pyrinomonadaceae bacterium]
MLNPERQVPDSDDSRRVVIIVVAIVAAVAIAALFYFLMRSSWGNPSQPTLEGAFRAGSPEFTQFQPRIVLDPNPPEAYESKQALGGIVMTLQTVARNFTGKTLAGLEVTGYVVDHQGQAIRQRAVIVIPGKQSELENNRGIPVFVMLEGMTDKDDRANIKMEVTAFKFQ